MYALILFCSIFYEAIFQHYFSYYYSYYHDMIWLKICFARRRRQFRNFPL